MSISEYASFNVSTSTTELSLISGTSSLQTLTDHGIYYLYIDPQGSSFADGDEFRVKIYEKVLSGGTKRVVDSFIISHQFPSSSPLPPLFWTTGHMLRNGWDMTIQKVAGTDRTIKASVRRVPCTINELFTQSALSVSTTELSMSNGTSTLAANTAGTTIQAFFDCNNMVKGDDYEITVYDMISASASRRTLENPRRLMDAQSSPNECTPMYPVLGGWDVSMKRIGGSDRTFDVSIRAPS